LKDQQMNEIVATSRQEPVVSTPALPVERVLQAIISAASDPGVDVAKMRELLGLQKELMAMQAEQQFNEAFSRLSRQLPRIKKDGSVEYKGQKAFNFATWENIDRTIRPVLEAEGFTLSFDTSPRQGEGGGIIVTGTLLHIGGHKRTASIPLALDSSGGKNNIQGMGSTFSYGKRYTATALLNIVTEGEDDDGHRGGQSFITDAEADDLRALAKEIGRHESQLLDQMFGGKVRSFDELEQGNAVLAVRNTMLGIKRAQQQKKAAP
jgi:hypothetical protein